MATSIATNRSVQHETKKPPRLAEVFSRWLWRVAILILISLVAGLAWFVAFGDLYKPGSTFGYNLGLVGGLMMLTLLLYPLRKRLPVFERLGSMMGWFKYHMVLGITAPVLILFHSTFRPVSINGKLAFYSMIMVLLSGLVGRYVYRHVHIGLYGRELTLADAEAEMAASVSTVNSVLALQPAVLTRLQAFKEAALARSQSVPHQVWRFLVLPWRAWAVKRSLRVDIQNGLSALAENRGWTHKQRVLAYTLADRQIRTYVVAVCKTASYSAWQYLFSLWHLVHLPFLYLLVISAIIHIIAVHMY